MRVVCVCLADSTGGAKESKAWLMLWKWKKGKRE